MTATIPVPATAAVGQLFTAAAVNAQRDTDTFLLGSGSNPFPACQAYQTGNLSNADTTFTLVTMDAEAWDTDGTMHSISSNTSRVIFPVTGTWSVMFYATWAANATGRRAINPRLNAAGSNSGGSSLVTWTVPSVGSTASTNLCLPIERRFTAADYVELFTYQSSGGALNATGSSVPWLLGITARFLSA